MKGDAITLGNLAGKQITMLEIACRRCERRGRLSVAHRMAPAAASDL